VERFDDVPMHTGQISAHQSGARNVERPGAHPEERNAGRLSLPEVAIEPRRLPRDEVAVSSAYGDIVEASRIDQGARWCHAQAAAGGYRLWAHDLPCAADLAAATAFVCGEAKRIDEPRKRIECEVVEEDEPDSQLMLRLRLNSRHRSARHGAKSMTSCTLVAFVQDRVASVLEAATASIVASGG